MNVMMMALQQEGCDTQWIDSRKQFKWDEAVTGKLPVGLLLCRREESTCMKKICRIEARHWVCIRPINGNFLLIDSKDEKPKYLTNISAMESYVEENLKNGTEVLFVFRNTSTSH